MRKSASPLLTPWPSTKPIPKFATLAEEAAFWQAHEFEDDNLEWEDVEGPATRRARPHDL